MVGVCRCALGMRLCKVEVAQSLSGAADGQASQHLSVSAAFASPLQLMIVIDVRENHD